MSALIIDDETRRKLDIIAEGDEYLIHCEDKNEFMERVSDVYGGEFDREDYEGYKIYEFGNNVLGYDLKEDTLYLFTEKDDGKSISNLEKTIKMEFNFEKK
jgi:hypothetical protein